jgi:hypothetical protein
MHRIVSELREWPDYLPAALWALVTLAAAAAVPVWSVLS